MDLNKFKSFFSESRLWNKLSDYTAKLGQKTVYSALLLYYAFKRKDTPYWAKNIVLGTLGYLISPIDFIPDLTPIIGYTDDISLLAFGLVTIACYVDDEVKVQSLEHLGKWFKNIDEAVITEVDAQL